MKLLLSTVVATIFLALPAAADHDGQVLYWDKREVFVADSTGLASAGAHFWNSQHTGLFFHVIGSKGCGPVQGAISVCIRGRGLGEAVWWGDSYMTACQITIRNRQSVASKKRVIAHELGHCAGLGHRRDRSLLMHPRSLTWHVDGHDIAALRARYA